MKVTSENSYHLDVWKDFEKGPFVPRIVRDEIAIEKNRKSIWLIKTKRKYDMYWNAKNIIKFALEHDAYYKVFHCKTIYQMWDTLEVTH